MSVDACPKSGAAAPSVSVLAMLFVLPSYTTAPAAFVADVADVADVAVVDVVAMVLVVVVVVLEVVVVVIVSSGNVVVL